MTLVTPVTPGTAVTPTSVTPVTPVTLVTGVTPVTVMNAFPQELLQQRRDIIAKIRDIHNVYDEYDYGQQICPDAQMNREEVPDSVRELLPLMIKGGEKGPNVKYFDKMWVRQTVYFRY